MRRTISDIIIPVLILYLAYFGAAVAVMGAAGVITGAGSLDADALLRACPQLPLLCSTSGYALALAAMFPLVRYDEMRFGRTFPVLRADLRSKDSVSGSSDEMAAGKWTGWHTALYIPVTALAAFGLSHLLLRSPLTSLFPGYSEQAAGVFNGQFPALMVLSYVILGPAAEELVFRCCLFRRLKAHMAWQAAAVLSSLLFGIWHGNMIQFLYASVLGLVLAWGYEKSGRILVCAAAHMAANLLAAVLTFID